MKIIGVFGLVLVYFAVFLPWNGFNDPDAFYHAKVSALLWSDGPLINFPWLDLTLVGRHYADLHFLFHVLVAPFAAALGMFEGLRLVTVVLAAACLTAAYAVFRGFGLRYAAVWVGILALTQPFAVRLMLGKASALAIGLFLAGILAVWRQKPIWVFGIAAVYALAHGGWLYLAGAALVLAFGRLFVDRDFEDMTLAQAVRQGLWKEVAAVFAGGLFGMLVHPNFPDNFLFSWTQVFVIGLGTPVGKVVMGSEWYPPEAAHLATAYAPWIIAGLLGVVGMFMSPFKPFSRKKASLVLAVGLLVAAMFALTLKSRRTTEFLAPTVALWCGAMWSMIDVKKLFAQAWSSLGNAGKYGRLAVVFALVVLSLGLASREALGVWQALHPVGYPDGIYRKSFLAVSEIAKPGDRVFHSSWDEFPMLFAADDRLRYISGMDPTFLYAASTTLSDDVKHLTWGMTSTTREQAWELIHDRLDSRFVFVSKRDVHRQFLELIESDERYMKLKEAEDGVVFEVRP